MATDFSYNDKTINSSGPIKPTGINQPLDPRTEVKLYADIKLIPNPYVGMIITVLEDETNSNKMTDYKVLSLKSDDLGVANSVVDRVQRYVEYLGVSAGGGTGLTTEQANNIAKIPAIQSTVDALPNNYASKNHNHSEYASSSHRHDASEIDNLPSGGGGLTSEQAQQLQTAYEHSQSAHVSMEEVNAAISNAQLGGEEVDTTPFATDLSLSGSSLQLKNSAGNLIGNAVTLPSSGSDIVFRDVEDNETFSIFDGRVYGNIVVSLNSLELNEGRNSSFTVNLDKQPSSSQTVTLSVNNSDVTLSTTSLMFTTDNYSMPQTVNVAIKEDDEDYSDETAIITISSSNVSSQTINITIKDNDEEPLGVTLSTSTLSVNEDSTNTFDVSLNKQPSTNKVITLSVNNSNITLDKQSLTFTTTDYSNPQTVTVTGVRDSSNYDNKSSVITFTGENITTKTLNVTIVNTDTISVTGVTLNIDNTSVDIDKTITLTAIVEPENATNKNIVWSADNSNVSVTNGVVRGLIAGESVVTVTTEDGNFTDTCTITVNAAASGGVVTDNLAFYFDAKDGNNNSATITELSPNKYKSSIKGCLFDYDDDYTNFSTKTGYNKNGLKFANSMYAVFRNIVPNTNCTVEVLARTYFTAGNQTLISQKVNSATIGGFAIATSNSSTKIPLLRLIRNSSAKDITITSNYTSGDLIHIAFTLEELESGTNTIKVYVNGELTTTETEPIYNFGSNASYTLGAITSGTQNGNCIIYTSRVYTSVLTQQEIQSNYQYDLTVERGVVTNG